MCETWDRIRIGNKMESWIRIWIRIGMKTMLIHNKRKRDNFCFYRKAHIYPDSRC
jgi:hypothetical protein